MSACFHAFRKAQGLSFLRCSIKSRFYATHAFPRIHPQPLLSKDEVMKMATADVSLIPEQIKMTVKNTYDANLSQLSQYSFDQCGKLVRPLLVTLLSGAINSHLALESPDPQTRYSSLSNSSSSEDSSQFSLFPSCSDLKLPESLAFDFPCLPNQPRQLGQHILASQHGVALIAEMIHTASLVQDDVLDCAKVRRGQVAAHEAFGQRQAIQAGDFVWLTASRLLAQLGETSVVRVLATVIEDLIKGELMQILPLDEDDNRRFQHYLTKTYRKTTSLIANSCKAVSILVAPHPTSSTSPTSKTTVEKLNTTSSLVEVGYQFGYHVGMTFQLLDDVLDLEQTSEQLGKPSCGADLKLGLSTGPVLFAAERFPHLNALIARKFSRAGDIEEVRKCIEKADGIGQTRMLAEFHLSEALRCLDLLQPSAFRECTRDFVVALFHRQK